MGKLSNRKVILMDSYSVRKRGLPAVAVILIVIATAVIAGGCVYLWQAYSYGDASASIKGLSTELDAAKAENSELQNKIVAKDKELTDLKAAVSNIEKDNASKTEREIVQAKSDEILHALKNNDMSKLSAFVHPDKGLRFTPYAYIDTKKDITIKADESNNLADETTKRTWGAYDGTGDPIIMTFKEYNLKFVYDKDFLTAPQIIYNQVMERGNSLNNIKEAYPGGVFIEYHFPGFEARYEGMDWESLKLVFEKKADTWYLTGIIHEQWTI